MNKKENIKKTIGIAKALEQLYPNPVCALIYKKPHELLIAARLSAQCTDKRVNMITPELFERFPEIKDFAEAEINEVEKYIRSCGLYKTKAFDIVEMCKLLFVNFDCVIPDGIEELLKLPGVGRKTANLIIGTLYGKPAVVTDTHVIRISNRLGLVSTQNPVKVENVLRELLPEKTSLDFCHRLVFFGREVCKARKPECGGCVLKEFCIFIANYGPLT